MKTWILSAALALMGSTAFAGFVDQRHQPQAPVAAVSAPANAASPAATNAGSPAAVATPAQPVQQTWTVNTTDGTLSSALLRWSRESGYPISYEAPSDLSAMSATYKGDFWTALEKLLIDTANGEYPLHGCQYDNVTRILSTSQPCNR